MADSLKDQEKQLKNQEASLKVINSLLGESAKLFKGTSDSLTSMSKSLGDHVSKSEKIEKSTENRVNLGKKAKAEAEKIRKITEGNNVATKTLNTLLEENTKLYKSDPKLLEEYHSKLDEIHATLKTVMDTKQKLTDQDLQFIKNAEAILNENKKSMQQHLTWAEGNNAAAKTLNTLLEETAELYKSDPKLLEEYHSKLDEIQATLKTVMDTKQKLTAQDLQFIKSAETVLEENKKSMEQQLNWQARVNKAQEDYQSQVDDVVNKIKDWGAKFKALILNPALLAGVALLAIGAAFVKLEKAAEDFRKSTGYTGENFKIANEQAYELVASTGELGIGLDESYAVISAIANEFGGLNTMSKDTTSNVAKMSLAFGMSADESAQLLSNFMGMLGGSEESATNMIKMSAALAKGTGLPPATIMKDIAASADSLAQFTQGSGENIGRAAVLARKLGINIGTVAGVAENLLNFESSIEAEMNAMVLTGKQINLDKARGLALAGDLEGLTREITDNLVSENEWSHMNFIERKAMAAAIGVNVNEMGKMVSRQRLINELSSGQLDIMESMAEGLTLSEVLDAQGILSPLTKLANVLTKIAGIALTVFGPILNAVSNMLDGITGSSDGWGKSLFKLIGIVTGATIAVLGLRYAMNKLHKGFASSKFDKFKELFGSKKTPDSKGGIFSRVFGGLTWGTVGKGIVLMIGMSAALWILSKALVSFNDVEWESLGKAGLAILGLIGAMTLLGILMSTGVFAVAVLAGAAAIAILAGSLWVMGNAIQLLSNADMSGFISDMTEFAMIAPGLLLVAGAMYALSTAVAAFAVANLAATGGGLLSSFLGGGVISQLQDIAELAVPLSSVANSVATISNGGVGSTIASNTIGSIATTGNSAVGVNDGNDSSDIVDKIDQFMKKFESGVELKLNGAKIGEFLARTERK